MGQKVGDDPQTCYPHHKLDHSHHQRQNQSVAQIGIGAGFGDGPDTVGVFTGSVATMAVPLAEFQLPVLLGPAVDITPENVLWSLGVLEVTVARAFALVIIAALTVLNILGTRLSTNAQVALTGIPMALLAVAAMGIFFTMEPATMQAQSAGEELTVVSFGRAVLAIYFAYAGWNAIAYVGGEMKNPA